ncbi:MAG: hypothetical protein JSW02_06970 [candidate division WOR-3 bacterium]|nr:MAG: hypothetical protein JSW02_06970 [candidate division WOR-3 bacterium]
MYKYSITLLFIVGLGFSYGVRPAFDFGFRWTNMNVSDEYADASEDYIALSIGTSVPYSKAVGLYVEIAAITFYDGDMTNINLGGGGLASAFPLSGIGSKFGLVEMIPSKSVSPFFKQYISLDRWSSSYDYSITIYSLGLAAGAEFLSTSNVSPLLEAFVSYGSMSEGGTYYDYSTDILNYGFSFSVRFSWEK